MRAWIVLPGGRLKRFRNRRTRHNCGKRRKSRPRVGYGLCHGREESGSRVERRLRRADLQKAVRSCEPSSGDFPACPHKVDPRW
jgi:hypothetical protein